eukprot:365211-Chlamydomonas_euryale.AAC.2
MSAMHCGHGIRMRLAQAGPARSPPPAAGPPHWRRRRCGMLPQLLLLLAVLLACRASSGAFAAGFAVAAPAEGVEAWCSMASSWAGGQAHADRKLPCNANNAAGRLTACPVRVPGSPVERG